jgi:hypothetical protein
MIGLTTGYFDVIRAHERVGLAAPIRLRAWVRIRRRALDRQIAAGHARVEDPALALRQWQLRRPCERRSIAACLANILEAAAEHQADPGARVSVNPTETLAAQSEIVALIALLSSDRAASPQGIARARLLTDSASPLLSERATTSVHQAVCETIDLL